MTKKKSRLFMMMTIVPIVAIALATIAITTFDRVQAADVNKSSAIGGEDANVNVAHFAPFASEAISTSVTVRVNGGDVLTEFEFGDIATDIPLPAGDYLIEILPTGTDMVAISTTVNLTDGVDYTVAAIGDGVNQALELFPLVNDTMPSVEDAKLRIAHLAPFDDMDTAVDICTDAGDVVVGGVAYKAFTDPYLELPGGDYDLLIALAGTNCDTVALDIPPVRLSEGEIVDVFAIGGANEWGLQVTSVTGLTFTPAAVSVAHFAPFAMSVADTSVTVQLNGSAALTDFQFGDIVDVELEAGEYLIEVLPTGTSTVAISGSVMLEGGVDYTLAAAGDGVNQELELLPFVDETTPAAAVEAIGAGAKVRIAHLAPFDDMDTAVDICTDADGLVLGDVSYKDFTDPYLVLPAGVYDLKVAIADTACATVALDLPALALSDGDIIDVFAIGGANGFDLAAATTTGLPLNDIPVSVAHFAPFASEAISTSVTVRVNGTDAITDFTFGDIVSTTLPAGEHLIEVLPTGTSTVAISGNVTLEPAGDYTLSAIGDGTNQPLELFPQANDTMVDPDNAKLRITHLAPFDDMDTAVDICTDAGDVVVGGVPYKVFTDPYLTLPAGDYDLQIAIADTNCETVALDIPSVRLAAGEIADVFAIGGANGWDLQVTSVTGLNFSPAAVSVAHLAPFATGLDNTSVTVRINGADTLTDFRFEDIVDTELPAGDYLIEILPTGTSTVAISGTVMVEAGGDYTLAAIGDGTNQPLELFALVDDATAPMAGMGRVRVAHLAPFASSGTEVDVCAGDTAVVSGVGYKGFTDPYLSLPAGSYSLNVTAAGSDCETVLFNTAFYLEDGDVGTVFAVGGANEFAPKGLVTDNIVPRIYLPIGFN